MDKTKSNIFLIGYMGSGKSTVGKMLAKRLGRDFLDMDLEIEKEQKMPITRIFMKYGEHQFRNLEAELLDKVIHEENTVISCGGGVILDDENRKVLSDENVIFLDCDPEIMFDRIKDNENLPNAYFNITDEEKRLEVFTGQYMQRKALYDDVSDIMVDTGGKNADAVVTEICNKLGRENK